LVYNGTFIPGVLSVSIGGLITGHLYNIRIKAVNYNGVSLPSASSSWYVCTAPANFQAPLLVSQTSSIIVLSWSPPGDAGGC